MARRMVARRADGTIIKEGDTVRSFRGDTWTFISLSNRGKVFVKDANLSREFFPQVFEDLFIDDISDK
jgi:hypothetical protein